MRNPILFTLTLFTILVSTLSAQDAGSSKSVDAATAASTSYLTHIAAKEWEAAGKLVKPEALKRQFEDYIMRARRARTIDEEVQLVSRVGVERLRDIEEMNPLQFYVASRTASEKANMLTPAVKAKMKESFKANVIGALPEADGKLIHVLTRTSHETLDTVISELLLLTLQQNEEGKWIIAPEHQKMTVSPLVTGELPEGLKERLQQTPAPQSP